MTRLTKKCMIASACLHGLLILVLLVGPAFFSKPVEPVDQIITIMPDAIITDGPPRGGGNPMAQQAPPPAPAPAPAPEPPAPQPTPPPVREPEPPKPQPTPPKPEPEPEPEREEPAPPKPAPPAKVKAADDIPVAKTPQKSNFELRPVDRNKKPTSKPTESSAKPANSKPSNEPKIVLNRVTGRTPTRPNSSSAASEKAASEKAAADAHRANIASQLKSGFGKMASSIQSSAASSTTVDMPGGPGGQAFVNYASLVRERFDSAWRDPADVADDNANVRVQVVIDRSGAVMSARIISKSGFSTMDKSVQSALDRVRSIGAPFPSSSSDRQRTFIINFNLKSRRLTG